MDNQSHSWLAFCVVPLFIQDTSSTKRFWPYRLASPVVFHKGRLAQEEMCRAMQAFQGHQMVFSLLNGHGTFHVCHPINGCNPHTSPLFEQACHLPLSLWLWNNCHTVRMPSRVVTWESLVPLYQVWICSGRMPYMHLCLLTVQSSHTWIMLLVVPQACL